jgi:hypothetical protein
MESDKLRQGSPYLGKTTFFAKLMTGGQSELTGKVLAKEI